MEINASDVARAFSGNFKVFSAGAAIQPGGNGVGLGTSAGAGAGLGAGISALTQPAGPALGGLLGGGASIGNILNMINSGVDFIENVDDMEPVDAAVQGSTYGSTIGSVFGGVGSVVGGIVGAIGGAVASLFGGGTKDPAHQTRNDLRSYLGQHTALGENLEFEGYIAPGEVGTLSLHGNDYNVDNSTGVLAAATGITNLLSYAIVGGNKELLSKNPHLMEQFSGIMLNTISGADDYNEALSSLRDLATKMGFTPESLAERTVQLYQQGVFDKQELKFYLDNVAILSGMVPPPVVGTPENVGPNGTIDPLVDATPEGTTMDSAAVANAEDHAEVALA